MKPANSSDGSSETALLTNHAADYANNLLATFGCEQRVEYRADHPAIAWKRAGLLHTTKLMLPSLLTSHVDGALMAVKTLCPAACLPENGALLMGERTRLNEAVRQGRQSPGGYGRLLEAKGGRIALNMVRDDDWDLIPAWLEDRADDWGIIAEIVKRRKRTELAARAAELGLAVAIDDMPCRPKTWFKIKEYKRKPPVKKPLVVDMSSLWAGPLASSLLGMTGAQVIRVESPVRPDGMRSGHQGFDKLINAGKDCVALNFRDTGDLEKLKSLLSKADIVIEASRPRALQQLGIVAEEFAANKPGQLWARITAYGRAENRIGFGDDIGVSAGLSTLMDRAHNEPCFVGDAIADPVTGIHLAFALGALYMQGRGAVLDVSMRDILRFAMGELPENPSKIALKWQTIADQDHQPLYEMRQPQGSVRELGADNQKWL